MESFDAVSTVRNLMTSPLLRLGEAAPVRRHGSR